MNEVLGQGRFLLRMNLRMPYLSYAMSVIVGRALPDVRDGLKPVHRRIIFAMHDLGNVYNKAHKKSARIVGEVIGKYHPHGDSSVYDAMVRLAQEWNLRYQLVDGQGNFGSIDGDNPAAMRYTEARMTRITDKFLKDIDKDTVKFRPNFDDSLAEPEVLPTPVPSLLINGSSGIAVGMATSIPPHNIVEILDAGIDVIDNPYQSVEDLVRKGLVRGPDFPTGALMLRGPGIEEIYIKGEGSVTMKAICRIEEQKKGKEAIIVEAIPYQVNKLNLINQIVDLVKNGRVKDIVDIRDESNKKGIRIVIETKRDCDPNIVLNQLYKFSSLKTNFSARMLAIVNGVPTILNLKSYLVNFIGFRKEVVINRTKFDLKKSNERLHILEGLVIALNNIDAVIELIKASESAPKAKEALMNKFAFSEIQSQATLDMRLQKLTGLEIGKIKDEHKTILEVIKDLESILASDSRQYEIIKGEFNSLKEQLEMREEHKLLMMMVILE